MTEATTPIPAAVLADPAVQAAVAAAEAKATAAATAAASTQVTTAKAAAFDTLSAAHTAAVAGVAKVQASVEHTISKGESKFAAIIKAHAHFVAVALSFAALALAGYAAYKLW